MYVMLNAGLRLVAFLAAILVQHVVGWQPPTRAVAQHPSQLPVERVSVAASQAEEAEVKAPVNVTASPQSRRVRIVSVHTGASDWVSMQARMVQRYVDLPFTIYASVNDGSEARFVEQWERSAGAAIGYVAAQSNVLDSENSDRSRCVLNAKISCDHGMQLNYLAKRACDEHTPANDVLLFLDADAWPLAQLSKHILPLMDGNDEVDFIAVRRNVEGVALWPHPSFALTTCGSWNKRAHTWSQTPPNHVPNFYHDLLARRIFAKSQGLLCNARNDKLDTGSPLWTSYNDHSRNWVALERINTIDLDPIEYGVYGHRGVAFAYHHGAGKRSAKIKRKLVAKDKQIASEAYERAASVMRDAVMDLLGRQNGMMKLVELLLHPEHSGLRNFAGKSTEQTHILAKQSSEALVTEEEQRCLLERCEHVRESLLKTMSEGTVCHDRVSWLCKPRRSLELIQVPATDIGAVGDSDTITRTSPSISTLKLKRTFEHKTSLMAR